jgi:sugar transferase (PEP-CTERM/EpsH1 system associated)
LAALAVFPYQNRRPSNRKIYRLSNVDDLLFLSQRIPFPPDKGDKIRSFHILEHLAQRFRVHLGCFIDSNEDEKYIADLNGFCASVFAVGLSPATRIMRGAQAFISGTSITEARFHDRKMRDWIKTVLSERKIRNIFAFGSAMVPLVKAFEAHKVLDAVDVDSEKWRAYANGAGLLMRTVYAREARKVLELERSGVRAFNHSLFVSNAERDTFLHRAPEAFCRVRVMNNGVDVVSFDPAIPHTSPFPDGGYPIVFTGTMNYRPNIDAVTHFARAIFPLVLARGLSAQFWIVGAQPASAVTALENGITIRVTGAVPDVRPYLQHAACVVAPLAIARGVQNKVLEAMAMARPVVASPEAGEGISAVKNQEILVAKDDVAFANAICDVLTGAHAGIGAKARQRIIADYQWKDNLQILDTLFT